MLVEFKGFGPKSPRLHNLFTQKVFASVIHHIYKNIFLNFTFHHQKEVVVIKSVTGFIYFFLYSYKWLSDTQ